VGVELFHGEWPLDNDLIIDGVVVWHGSNLAHELLVVVLRHDFVYRCWFEEDKLGDGEVYVGVLELLDFSDSLDKLVDLS